MQMFDKKKSIHELKRGVLVDPLCTSGIVILAHM